MKNQSPFQLALVILFALNVVSARAQQAPQHWNQFRGPSGDGIATTNHMPIDFDESTNVRWKISIPHAGWSSPVIWENEIWLTTGSVETKELRAICIDLETGKVKQDIKVFDMVERKVDPAYAFDSPHLNSPATPTSVVEEDRVYVSFGSQGIACLDRQTGDKVWERRDLRIYQPVRQGSSPIVDDDNLYVAFDGTDQQFFIALDKGSGDTRWRVDRNVETDWRATLQGSGLSAKKGGKPNDNKKSFATATLIEVDGKRQLIAPAAEATISYAPETGEELWRTVHPGGFNVAARPIFANGLVYVFTSGLNHFLMGIRPDGTGDVTDTHIAWSTAKSTPSIPSPVIARDLLFMVTDKGGVARCLDATTGEEIWKKRLGGDHWASPVYADGRLYFSSKNGDVTVLEASRVEPEILARNKMNATFIASPAVAGSSLILRSTTHLYCVTNGHQRTPEQVAADVYPEHQETKRDTTKATAIRAQNKGLAALGAQLKKMVKDGKLTAKDATELYQAAANK
ncbi:MAG: PQQ-binding-like beta-propeller repeat protein [Rubripirellula sp.]